MDSSSSNNSFNVPAFTNVPAAHVQHSYGTRIRNNSVIKPSARLRQSPAPPAPPRKIRPAISIHKPDATPATEPPQDDTSLFPFPHVILHIDDSSSKVFLAIGRAFMSVNNRAMTIKDLSEMTLKHGLMCQNVSAAGQAITTYIRNHMSRCEAQQDLPLLARHTLSGSSSDDDLLPALYSRTGGAHCPLPKGETRVTNFRRGTQVWYLSRASGAPCPFARAGIRLCEYNENGKIGALPVSSRERKRERDRARRQEMCGQKRKRPLRACADGRADEGSESASDTEKRPSKVKLTLRLRPGSLTRSPSITISASPSLSPPPPPQSATLPPREIIDLSRQSDSDDGDSDGDDDDAHDDDDDDEMSLDSESSESEEDSDQDASMSSSSESESPATHTSFQPVAAFRRSPSLMSLASLPPDSEDDVDYFEASPPMWSAPDRRRSVSVSWGEQDEEDFDWSDSDDDDEEPLGPAEDIYSDAPDHLDEVRVKQEQQEEDIVGGTLEEYDRLDIRRKLLKVVTDVAKSEIKDELQVKDEEQDWSDFDRLGAFSPSFDDPPSPFDHPYIKEEDREEAFLEPLPAGDAVSYATVPDEDEHICGSPLTPLSALSPDSEPDGMRWACERRPSELLWQDVELLGPDSISPQDIDAGTWDSKGPQSRSATASAPRFHLDPSFDSPPVAYSPSADSDDTHDDAPRTPPLVSPSYLTLKSPFVPILSTPRFRPRDTYTPSTFDAPDSLRSESVVVHTCEPCTPGISATQFEGISVYQMTIGSTLLLRRLDTDFVNLGSIINHFNIPVPRMASIPNAITITHGSTFVCGTWVPLAEARAFVAEHSVCGDVLDVFLSDSLSERFPPALQEFHRSGARGWLLTQFGPSFRSSFDGRVPFSPRKRDVLPHDDGPAWESPRYKTESFFISSPKKSNFELEFEDDSVMETPLSPTEQEVFQTLVDFAGWESSPTPLTARPLPQPSSTEHAENMSEKVPEKVREKSAIRRRSRDRDRAGLRRSMRVANATARSRTRSCRRA